MNNIQAKTHMRANFYKKKKQTVKCFKIVLGIELQPAWQLDTMLIRLSKMNQKIIMLAWERS